MRLIADFHIHSKYSRATSSKMDLENLSEAAYLKGINILGTGDFTHPLWIEELKSKLKEYSYGLFRFRATFFVLTTEVSNIFTKDGRLRKIHNIIFAPNFEVVEKINKALKKFGALESDGRPTLSLAARDLVEIVLEISENCLIVPSHAWTPWFSLFGANSGFDSLEECFEELSPYIYAIETGLSCYDEKTEVLTDNGWKNFSEVRYSDRICTLNHKADKIEFQNPIRIFTYKYQGQMYKLKTKRVDLLVTPNHKLLFSPCNFRKPPHFFLKEAEFLFNKSKRFKKDGSWIGKDVEYFTLPAVKIKHGSQYYSGFRNKREKRFPIKSWLKFFGFWIAEGWTNQGQNGDYNVCITNRNKALLSEMKRILENFGYNVYQRRNVIRIRDYQLFHYLKQFGKSSDKFIPLDIKSLSKELLEILLEYYIKGDGHIYGRNGKGLSATTTSIRLRDDLQEIALKIGISAYYRLDQKKGIPFHGGSYKGRIYKQKEDSWVVYFIRRNKHTVLPSIIKKYNYIESWVDYDGLVYCVAVPNQVIYIRRNGIPLWCGNSDPEMNWRLSPLDHITLISNSDAHSPAKIGREANVFDAELDYLEILRIIKEKDSEKFLSTIEFFPQEGKYHYDGHRNCDVRCSPKESRKNKNICPVCRRQLTIGVMHRVENLADREEKDAPPGAIGFKHLIPLQEIISEVLNKEIGTTAVENEYRRLVETVGTEFEILLDLPREELAKAASDKLVEAIIKVREGKVNIEPGYDGVYGKISIPLTEKKEPAQMGFF